MPAPGGEGRGACAVWSSPVSQTLTPQAEAAVASCRPPCHSHSRALALPEDFIPTLPAHPRALEPGSRLQRAL